MPVREKRSPSCVQEMSVAIVAGSMIVRVVLLAVLRTWERNLRVVPSLCTTTSSHDSMGLAESGV
jgi:hypothetical protein